MKKLLALILAVALMLSASLALAEDAALANARDTHSHPYVAIGSDWHEALETFNAGWKQSGQYSYSDTPENEIITLSDGTSIAVMTLPAEKTDNTMAVPTIVKLYFMDNKLVAAVQIADVPEGYDPARFAESMASVMGYAPTALDTSKLSARAMELLGETAHLEDGVNAWPYDLAVNVDGNPSVVNVMLVAHIADNKLYMAELAYKKAESNTVGGQNLAEVEGFDKLSAEEQSAVRLYAEFLQKQQSELLKQYVDFLQTKHQ